MIALEGYGGSVDLYSSTRIVGILGVSYDTGDVTVGVDCDVTGGPTNSAMKDSRSRSGDVTGAHAVREQSFVEAPSVSAGVDDIAVGVYVEASVDVISGMDLEVAASTLAVSELMVALVVASLLAVLVWLVWSVF